MPGVVIPAGHPGAVARTAGVVLAAGSSRRTGGVEKLVVPVEGRPMVRRVAETALAAGLDPVLVVVGADARAEPVRQALGGLPVVLVTNRDPSRGLASSLARGVSALPASTRAAAILLGDMPWVQDGTVRALVAALESASPAATAGDEAAARLSAAAATPARARPRVACIPVYEGRRGNPVVWGAGFFPDMVALEGDRGARILTELHPALIREVPVDDPGILRDVDTVEDLERLRREAPWPT